MEPVKTKPINESSFYQDKIWFQCENDSCLKWRLVSKNDSLMFDHSLPWYCHMNTDPHFNNCTVPEEYFPEESQFNKNGFKLVFSQFPAGSLVLVKFCTWPRWPGILCPDPFIGEYIKYASDGYVDSYHVEFLGKPHTTAWISVRHVSPYHSSFKPNQLIKKKEWYESSLEEAKKMHVFNCEQRLSMCKSNNKTTIKKAVEREIENRKLSKHKIKGFKREYTNKNALVIRKSKKKRMIFYSSKRNFLHGILSKDNMVVSETESILKDLEKVLKQVTDSGELTHQLPANKEDKKRGKVSQHCMNQFEDIDEEDCVIIDGIMFKTAECIENITDTFKELDTLMTQLQSDF